MPDVGLAPPPAGGNDVGDTQLTPLFFPVLFLMLVFGRLLRRRVDARLQEIVRRDRDSPKTLGEWQSATFYMLAYSPARLGALFVVATGITAFALMGAYGAESSRDIFRPTWAGFVFVMAWLGVTIVVTEVLTLFVRAVLEPSR